MRKTFILLPMLILSFSGICDISPKKVKTALLIIDIQEFYFSGEGSGLVNAEGASLVAKDVLNIFRENKQTVIHVRHKSNKGFEIHKNVFPVDDEKIVTKEKVNCFTNTGLLEYLKGKDIGRLVLIGMQTHMCLEAATRAASDFGFECVVIQDACATRNLKFADDTIAAEDVHKSTLVTLRDGGYAQIVDFDMFRENQARYLFEKIK